jgi:ubiquinone/menaquinone biosynthesis C-methylase UbiE
MSEYSNFARFYDVLTENVDYSHKADFIEDILKENSINEGILLDLACGTGSMSLLMAKKGYDVIGVDISSEMLSEAMQKTYEQENQILFLCQPMQELDLYGTVDAAICVLDSLNHIENTNDLEETFKRVSLFLNPNGVFVFDLNTRYKHEHILANNTFVYDCEDVYCVWQNKKLQDSVEISLDFFERDEDVYYKSEETFLEYTYDDQLVKDIIKKCGLKLIKCYDDYTRNEVGEKTQRTVYVVKKV